MYPLQPLTRRTVITASLACSVLPTWSMTASPAGDVILEVISGRLVNAQGLAMAHMPVRLSNGAQTRTDADGRFFMSARCHANDRVEMDCQINPSGQAQRLTLSLAHHDGRAASVWAQLPG